MRCEHDTATATLPGVPELPVKPTRTTQAERMTRMGYQAPKVRPRCENCVKLTIDYTQDAYETEILRCSIGNFPVQRGSLCREWMAA